MKTLRERFEEKFTKTEGCWEWGASKHGEGYGQFILAGHVEKAHRVAYQLYVGTIPKGLCVCHHCDNTGCVNPSHLFLGTHTDNMRDRENKGRKPDTSGENNGHSKLTEEDVRTIRIMWSNGVRQVEIADKFGVSQVNISRIICGHNWSKV